MDVLLQCLHCLWLANAIAAVEMAANPLDCVLLMRSTGSSPAGGMSAAPSW